MWDSGRLKSHTQCAAVGIGEVGENQINCGESKKSRITTCFANYLQLVVIIHDRVLLPFSRLRA